MSRRYKPQKFMIGDLVRYVGPDRHWSKGLHIIKEVVFNANPDFRIATNRGAWMKEGDFVLILRASHVGLKKLEEGMYQ